MYTIFEEDNQIDDERTYEIIMEEIYQEVFESMNSTSNISVVEDIFDGLSYRENLLEEEIYDSDDEIIWIPEE